MLIVAGFFEAGWAVGLKYTDGFTRFWPSVFTLATMLISVWMLSYALRGIPVGTAYAVWAGIGSVLLAIIGIGFFGESANPARLIFLAMVIVGLIGLKFTAPN